jgi:hypothetical protein
MSDGATGKKVYRAKQFAVASLVGFAGAAIVISVIVLVIYAVRRRVKQQLKSIENGPIKTVDTGFIDTAREIKQVHRTYGKRKELEEPTIFISIPSYRDPELVITIEDAYRKAMHPHRLVFGVCQQNSEEDAPTAFAENAAVPKEQLRIKSMHFKEAQGPTMARYWIEQLWKDEEYVLMSDSHIRWEPGWDVQLLDMLFKCPRPQRTVLTMYPEGFKRINRDGNISYTINSRKSFRVTKFQRFTDEGFPTFASYGGSRRPSVPPLQAFLAAGFAFAHSDMFRLVPFSPNTPGLVLGEEAYHAARLFTHGFDLRAPTHSVVYHLWDRNYRPLVWNDKKLGHLKKKSCQLVHDILSEKTTDPQYGLGKVRPVSAYWNLVGVDFKNKKETRPPKPWTVPSNYRPLADEFCKDKSACLSVV